MKILLINLGFLLFANVLLGQVGLTIAPTHSPQNNNLNFTKINTENSFFLNKKNPTTAPTDLKKYLLSDKAIHNSTNIFTQKNKKMELAFFCKIEAEIEQSSRVPLKFRLGEVQAVDRKEGKWKQFDQ